MATQADVRRIALSFPATEEASDRFAFSVMNKGKLKGFIWVWMERVTPKKARVPNPGVIAARVANLGQRDLMLSADPTKFFTEPHYVGFPAVLVRLKAVSVADLKLLIAEAWRCQAPAELTKAKPSAPGYSGTPLPQKLGITRGTRLLALNKPPAYREILGDLPPEATLVLRAGASVDIAHLFTVRRAEMERQLKRLRASLRPDAAVWVSWPKKTAKVPTDITEDVIRAVALPMGFVDVKVCAVTDVWSGLKLVVRKELR